MDWYINTLKPQINAMLTDKRYNVNDLKLQEIDSRIIKIYYKRRFVKYFDTKRFRVDDLRRPFSDEWTKFKKILMLEIVKIQTYMTDLVTIVPVSRGHNMLQKCINCLQKQTLKTDIILLVSSDEDRNFALINGYEFVDVPKTSLINAIKTGIDYVKNSTDYQALMICFQNDILPYDWTKDGNRLLEANDLVGGQRSIIIDKSTDTVYSRKLNNDKAKVLVGSVNDLVINSGKMMKRNMIDRIRTNIMKDSLDNNDITLFNNVLTTPIKVGVIDGISSIKVITDGNVSDFIRKHGNSSFNDYEKLKFLPNKEAELISKLDIKKIDASVEKPEDTISDKTDERDIQIKFSSGSDMFGILGINQVKISDHLISLSDRVKKSYGLSDYNDRLKPALFYGMFSETDLQSLRDHRDKKYLLWDGDDILYLKSDKDEIKLIPRIKKISDVIHIAPSGAVYTALRQHGISSHKVKINFSLNDDRFNTTLPKFGNNVLICNGTNQNFEDRYNKKLYEQLIKKMPDIKFLFTNKLTPASNDMFKVYKECFVGLRLCKTDGVAQFVTDLSMLGIPIIHNGEHNGTIRWKTIDDITTTIRSLAPVIEKPQISKVHKPIIKLSDITFQLSKEHNTVPTVKSNNIIVKYPFNADGLYSIKINGFKSASRRVKIVLVTITNDNYVLIDSYLSPELALNLNYIDTRMYKSLKQLLINDNDGSEFSFDQLVIDEIDHVLAKNEAYESKTLDVDEVRTYKHQVADRYIVGCIMDTFTYTCFGYEVKLIQIKPDDWMDVINNNSIDFFLFESAWHGNNGLWDKQLTSFSKLDDTSEIKRLMRYLNEKKVPKVFYNKEDPFNYDMFSAFAKEFNGPNDLVVTTDENVIDTYKSIGCTNVHAFPFCCQPIIHNPVGKDELPGKEIIFPCSYYGFKYPERCKHMNEMIDLYIDNIDIFDRQFVFNKQTRQIHEFHKYKDWYEFPEKYRSRIKGSLNYEQVVSLYRKYKCVMNTNTATNSRTMFSRRAIEAAASGVPIISDHALGIETIFGDTATYYDEPDKVKKLLTDTNYRRSISDKIYKKVMHNYTYKHLIRKIIENIPSLSKDICDDTNDAVLCLIFVEDAHNLHRFADVMSKQKYLIISNTIVNPNLNIIRYDQLSNVDRSFGYYVIMNEGCIYEPDYVNNMLLPTLYTDVVIIGKGAFMHNDSSNVVSAELGHRFSNRLNINTIVIKNTDSTSNLFDSNIISNIESYMASSFNGSNMYSADMFDFVDTDVSYHYYNRYVIDMDHLIAKGLNVVQTVPIIMCCYNRIDLIGETIKCLNEQTDRNFILYIWNNRCSEKDRLIDGIKKAGPNFNVICHHSKENVGGIGRFYMIRELLKSKDYKYVMFIDDDQRLDKQVVEKFKQAAKPKHSYNWYGRRFVKGEPYANIHHDGHVKLNSQPIVAGEPYDYGGTGGMIIDADIFKHDDLFESLPRKFKFVEDLWMSYYGTVKLGYRFIKIDQGITQIKDGKDQCSKIWDVKNLLLEYCRSQGWDV